MGQASLLLSSRDKLSKARAEVFAYYMARKLSFNNCVGECIAPEAVILNLYGEWGVFIRFLDGYQEPPPNIEPFLNPNKKELYNFQMLAIYDFLIGNLDRHKDNIFIKENFEDFRCIDQGNSFPYTNPKPGSISGRNMYLWTKFEVAKEAFLPEIKTHIRDNLNKKEFENCLFRIIPNDLYNNFIESTPRKGNKALEYLELRRQFLIEVIAEKGNDIRPCDLVKFKMKEAMVRALNKALTTEESPLNE